MSPRRTWLAACVVATLALTGCGQTGSGDTSPRTGSLSPSPSPTQSPTAEPGDATLTGRLLFSRFDESSHTFVSTHTARPDGSQETEIPMPGEEGGGRWARSGHHIAVSRVLADGRIGTAILSPEGTVERELDIPDDRLNLPCTVWSPDDTRLACEGWDDEDPSRNGLYMVRASDGGGLVRLTRTPSGLGDLLGDFSPDGTTILFKRTTGEDPGPLMQVPAAGGAAKELPYLAAEDPGRYSPDGQGILTSSGGRVLLLNSTGDEVGRIERSGLYLFGPVWSPDGMHIAFSGTTVGVFAADLYTSLPDGTEVHQLTATPDNEIRVEWGND